MYEILRVEILSPLQYFSTPVLDHYHPWLYLLLKVTTDIL